MAELRDDIVRGVSKPSRRRRGSATLEFALMLPILTTVMLLCVDFGRFAHTYIAVTNAARAGAGVGSYNRVTPATKPLWDAAIEKAVKDELIEGDGDERFDLTLLVVATPQSIDEGGGLRRAQVEVSYPFQTLINWPFLPGYNDTFTLRKVVVMRAIR